MCRAGQHAAKLQRVSVKITKPGAHGEEREKAEGRTGEGRETDRAGGDVPTTWKERTYGIRRLPRPASIFSPALFVLQLISTFVSTLRSCSHHHMNSR